MVIDGIVCCFRLNVGAQISIVVGVMSGDSFLAGIKMFQRILYQRKFVGRRIMVFHGIINY